MQLLNGRLPKAKFDIAGKKTVCFVDKENEVDSSLRPKLTRFRSEKTLSINE